MGRGAAPEAVAALSWVTEERVSARSKVGVRHHGFTCVDSFLFVHRKVHDRTVHHGSGLLCIVVSGLPPRVRCWKMDSSRKATGGSIPDLGVVDRLPERALAVGRALILQCLLVARALASALRANLVPAGDGRTDRF